jgi:carbon monoxide dehydrogenase subunit G
MRIENTVEVDAPLERVWALVNDIPRVAPCMPGAALTGVGDDGTYEGTVAVKLGPLRMTYKGKVSVDEVDDANHSARLTASGKDTKGAGTARASVETRLEPAGETHTRLQVTSDVQLTGKVASFGRGGAINDVATRLFGQFADCLRSTLESEAPTAAAAPAPAVAAPSPAAPAPDAGPSATPAGEGAPTPATAAEGAPVPATQAAPSQAGATTPTAAAASSAAGAATPAAEVATPASQPVAAGDGAATAGAGAPVPAPTRQVEALDAGSLVGTVIKGRLQALWQAIAGFFRRLFGGRRNR